MRQNNKITSMTGFGSGQAEGQGQQVGVELRSVNSRYLDIQIRSPANLQPFEQAIRERIQAAVSRGKLSANISWAEEGQQTALPQLDAEVAAAYMVQLEQLAKIAKTATDLDLGLLSRLPGIFRFEASEIEGEDVQ
ncbi:MAG: YicC/YloC family endoribonuclease, partial [Candidatus Latescibacteria bacterium]|nr:YicC/YloC family endoribonuclease [Candidatus Latescibacterota bacterium]